MKPLTTEEFENLLKMKDTIARGQGWTISPSELETLETKYHNMLDHMPLELYVEMFSLELSANPVEKYAALQTTRQWRTHDTTNFLRRL